MSNPNADILAISRWIDSSAGYRGVSPETAMWRRTVGKLSEEVGEVSEALAGLVGENPRKGVTHAVSDLRYELLDVAAAALGALCHTYGNANECEPLEELANHVHEVRRRALATTLPYGGCTSCGAPAHPLGSPTCCTNCAHQEVKA